MGAISISCNKCGMRGRAKAEHAGRTVKCPKCGSPVAVPAEISRPKPPAGRDATFKKPFADAFSRYTGVCILVLVLAVLCWQLLWLQIWRDVTILTRWWFLWAFRDVGLYPIALVVFYAIAIWTARSVSPKGWLNQWLRLAVRLSPPLFLGWAAWMAAMRVSFRFGLSLWGMLFAVVIAVCGECLYWKMGRTSFRAAYRLPVSVFGVSLCTETRRTESALGETPRRVLDEDAATSLPGRVNAHLVTFALLNGLSIPAGILSGNPDILLFTLIGGSAGLIATLVLWWVLSTGHRMAWQYSRLTIGLGLFIAVLFFLGSVAIAVTGTTGAAGIGFLAQVVNLTLGISLFRSLGHVETMRFFRLVCPQCGHASKITDDFLFRRAKCRACNVTW